MVIMNFDFFLEVSKKKVKLSFITPTDDKELKEIEKVNKNNPVNPFMTKQLEKIVKEIDGIRDANDNSSIYTDNAN